MSIDLKDFVTKARNRLDWGIVNRAIKMLRRERHLMHIERTSEGIAGIVKSQTNMISYRQKRYSRGLRIP
ncbi:MAG: hypothetical protein GF364_07670 [Candidatus Lokiarchaeota archaeon]|nr:hypothetical protein [Candidatus Lokiarchaeota archaeon]